MVMGDKIKISVVLPCLNEEAAIINCLTEIQRTIADNKLRAEVIVVNNNSFDNSEQLILDFQKKFPELSLIKEKKQGYGFAYLKGLGIAGGDYIFMADADGTYHFTDIPFFIKKLDEGYDLVIGNRFSGKIAVKAMPWLHRHIGNPFLSFLVRLLFKVRVKDVHCGARAITKKAFDKINLCTGGMEFASEMIIKAARADLKITEVPIDYENRVGTSKLRSWADGWRHLRFILIYSPAALFIIPGACLLAIGVFFSLALYFNQLIIFGIHLYSYPIFIFLAMVILGYQLIIFGLFSKIYTITHLGDKNALIEKLFKHVTIVKISLLGLVGVLASLVLFSIILKDWIGSGFGSIKDIKNFVLAFAVLIIGSQTFFSAFIFSILGIKEK